MSKLEFTARDFIAIEGSPSVGSYGPSAEEMAKAANARLAEMLAAAPVVYGNSHNATCDNRIASHAGYGDIQLGGNTHRARLVDVEELPR